MFTVKKINKKYWIINSDNETLYTPPDFIKLKNVEQMENLAQRLSEKGFRDIETIQRWETEVRPLRR
jgi:hypothetical protein